MSRKDLYNNCVTDLYRSAKAFITNPTGKTHLVFLKHARQILGQINEVKAQKISQEIFKLERKSGSSLSKKEVNNLADKMLTFGSMLRA